MKYLKVKNQKIRKNFSKQEKNLKIKKFVFINLLNRNINNKKGLVYSFLHLNKRSNINKKLKTRIVNRCLVSNSARSMSSSFKLSRRHLKNLLTLGLIPGYKKSV